MRHSIADLAVVACAHTNNSDQPLRQSDDFLAAV
jgi:hypothetical protein